MAQMAQTFQGIVDFHAWLAGGGEARTGLDRGTFAVLSNNMIRFQATAAHLGALLDEIAAAWRDVEGDNSIKAALESVLADLADTRQAGQQGVTDAMSVKVSANEIYGVIGRHETSNQREIVKLNSSIQAATRRITQERAKVKAARAELRGEKGFLNGFLTGLTLGIHNPVKQNIDRINASIANITTQKLLNQQRARQLRTFGGELRASQRAVEKITGIDRSMSDFQNSLVDLSPLVETAYTKLNRAEHGTSRRVVDVYLKKAKPKMAELLSWRDQFRAIA